MRELDAQLLEQRGGIVRHLAGGVRPGWSRGAARTPVVEGDDPEALGKRRQEHRPPERVATDPGDQQEWRPTPRFLVVEVEPIDGSKRHGFPRFLPGRRAPNGSYLTAQADGRHAGKAADRDKLR